MKWVALRPVYFLNRETSFLEKDEDPQFIESRGFLLTNNINMSGILPFYRAHMCGISLWQSEVRKHFIEGICENKQQQNTFYRDKIYT